MALLATQYTGRDVVDVSLEGQDFEYGFAILFDPVGQAIRVSPPFGIRSGRLTFGNLPTFPLEDEQHLLLITLPAGVLSDAVPAFDMSRRASCASSSSASPASLDTRRRRTARF